MSDAQPSLLVSNRHGLAGQDLKMTVHVKYGRDPGKLLRVYYAIPKGEEVLVVGHCDDQAAQEGEGVLSSPTANAVCFFKLLWGIMKQIAIATLILALASAMLAQTNSSAATASNPVVNTVKLLEKRQSKNLIGAADEMPAEKYSYHPTPEQMSFAHLVVHIMEANNGYCARIAGEQPREVKVSESDSKDALTKALKDSFAYCEQVLAKADDSTLGQPVALRDGSPSTRAAALIYLAAGWADHYSAAAMYLRLNNLLPPSAQKAPAK